jgi:hypothetical protein
MKGLFDTTRGFITATAEMLDEEMYGPWLAGRGVIRARHHLSDRAYGGEPARPSQAT